MDPITIRQAIPSDNFFIYNSLKDMADEEKVPDRFYLTAEYLYSALFSADSFAEVRLAYFNDQAVGVVLFSVTNRNFDLFKSPGIYIHNIYIQAAFRRKKN